MSYEPKNYEHLIGLPGFSDQLLQNHFKLYQGYVTNTNKLADTLQHMVEKEMTATPEFAELKRRFGWEFNGMRLHEYYFENMVKSPESPDMESALAKQCVTDFGSVENCKKDFMATSGMRGIGWTILTYDTQAGRLFNVWINEHDIGHLAGGVPIVVLDCFEHAYMLDYGVSRADYINAFFTVLDNAVIERRFAALV